ncbi:MAG: hypothetical protein ACRD2L_06365, partial [Terriglobia bacterium]
VSLQIAPTEYSRPLKCPRPSYHAINQQSVFSDQDYERSMLKLFYLSVAAAFERSIPLAVAD